MNQVIIVRECVYAGRNQVRQITITNVEETPADVPVISKRCVISAGVGSLDARFKITVLINQFIRLTTSFRYGWGDLFLKQEGYLCFKVQMQPFDHQS